MEAYVLPSWGSSFMPFLLRKKIPSNYRTPYEIRLDLRVALESRDKSRINKFGDELGDALEAVGRSGAISSGDGYHPALRMTRISSSWTSDEINDLSVELLPDRLTELQNVPVFFEGGLGIGYAESMLAVVLDQPSKHLANWERFQQEKSTPSYLWGRALLADPKWTEPLVPPGLSYNARLALSVSKVVTRLLPVTLAEFAERVSVSQAVAQSIMTELHHAGLARASTEAEFLLLLTVAQLDTLLVDAGLSKSAAKDRKIRTILENLSADQILSYIKQIDPTLLEKIWTIGLDKKKESEFHRQWSEVVGHFLTFSVYRDGDWKEREDARSNGLITKSWRIETRCAPNSCEICQRMDRKQLSSRLECPPFHIGCRCSTVNVPPAI